LNERSYSELEDEESDDSDDSDDPDEDELDDPDEEELLEELIDDDKEELIGQSAHVISQTPQHTSALTLTLPGTAVDCEGLNAVKVLLIDTQFAAVGLVCWI
jgi:hypothetical protein